MLTRLETFIKSRGIKPAHLARESGYSRQHLLRIRMGRMEPTRRCIAAIVTACRRLSHEAVRAPAKVALPAEGTLEGSPHPPLPPILHRRVKLQRDLYPQRVVIRGRKG